MIIVSRRKKTTEACLVFLFWENQELITWITQIQIIYTILVQRITRNVCENFSFEKVRTIPINLIQLHYFDDVISEFNLIDLEIRWMNCDYIDLKQKTINCNGVNLENLFIFFSCIWRATGLPGYLLFPIVLRGLPTGYLLLVALWSPQISHVWIITRNVCENYSFEKIRTIPINLIQLHYLDDVRWCHQWI